MPSLTTLNACLGRTKERTADRFKRMGRSHDIGRASMDPRPAKACLLVTQFHGSHKNSFSINPAILCQLVGEAGSKWGAATHSSVRNPLRILLERNALSTSPGTASRWTITALSPPARIPVARIRIKRGTPDTSRSNAPSAPPKSRNSS